MRFVDLHWLPPSTTWKGDIAALHGSKPSWVDLFRLSNVRLNFIQTNQLNNALSKNYGARAPADLPTKPVRLAILSSSTCDHLIGGMRVAALRRNIWLDTYVPNFGQYYQELLDEKSEIYKFKPDVILFALDAHHLLGDYDSSLSREEANATIVAAIDRLSVLWRLARQRFGAQVIQQTIINVFPRLMGNNEHRLAASPFTLVELVNVQMKDRAVVDGVDILSVDQQIAQDGFEAWSDPMLWHRAKQEISPAAAPAYGELLVRLIAAAQGRSYKCLALDLDNTLWGGVIGDDGLEGIKLGQGSAIGEAYVDFQRFVRNLGKRGVILAVCSKNDESNALAPFTSHPEMILRNDDIACFVANWDDKATNIRRIAKQLNIGSDSIVFADDNIFERNFVRSELSEVAVPELAEDPALYAKSIADAGYFEALQITTEDLNRGDQYRANLLRENLRVSNSDLPSYLKSLQMELRWSPFDQLNLQRTVQLINKTNQFNLTTRRYSESEVARIANAANCLTLQLRLVDRFGDNGIICIVIGVPEGDSIRLDTWLMSCRVLGRQVEEETLTLVVKEAQKLGALKLIGEFRPTKKNGMVKEHYQKLGFNLLDTSDEGVTTWELVIANYNPSPTFINSTRI